MVTVTTLQLCSNTSLCCLLTTTDHYTASPDEYWHQGDKVNAFLLINFHLLIHRGPQKRASIFFTITLCGISWWIFTLFVPMVTGKNTV